MRRVLAEHHFVHRLGWLRASVLGANDGLISTASLVLGVGSAALSPHGTLSAGVAGLVAGASVPVILIFVSPTDLLMPLVAVVSLVFLAALGAAGAKAGGAKMLVPSVRVTLWAPAFSAAGAKHLAPGGRLKAGAARASVVKIRRVPSV